MKKQNTKGCLSEILRFALNAVVVVFLLSCMTFLYLDHIRMTQRLTAIDEKMDAFEQTFKKLISTSQYNEDRDGRFDAKGLLVRKKRAQSLSLESLEKRLKILEFR